LKYALKRAVLLMFTDFGSSI